MAIRALSFDFDGCLFNESYCEAEGDSKCVIRHNQTFLDRIALENREFKSVTTFIGSNRQSYEIDQFCIKPEFSGSCFPEIIKISDYLQTTLDDFLIADIYGDLSSGTSYKRAMDASYTEEHSECPLDFSKLSLLYAQIHKMAFEHPDEEVIFDFYDDRGKGCRNHDLLEELHEYFSRYPESIPANVTLRLNHYAGEEITPFPSIQGQGTIDKNYRQTVMDMVTITDELLDQLQSQAEEEIDTRTFSVRFVTPALLQAKASQRTTQLESLPSSATTSEEAFTMEQAAASKMLFFKLPEADPAPVATITPSVAALSIDGSS